ncbi:hypothetical protein IQ13_4156 [Lacibacter cauensis]|uniref:DinB family protein n=1 Tax=Lacibacter cauensis TaxID=510947 RepID=A0A562SB63_9BACT|nr:hypothetical protein [Lacibacter cauensis]TWI77916.1 hypothetical protein IQ13_4156 [Lacibacter cauensis]
MNNQLLIHVIKTIAYRFVKSTTGSTATFGTLKINDHTRSPNEIIFHMYDLAVKTTTMIKEGHFNVPIPQPLNFHDEQKRFLTALQDLQSVLEESHLEQALSQKLLQGPLLDMVTHVGQLAMLNGIHGNRIPKESYFNAKIN